MGCLDSIGEDFRKELGSEYTERRLYIGKSVDVERSEK